MNTKFIKKFGIAMVAILIAVGFSAYKVGESNFNKVDPTYKIWYYHGINTTDVNDPSKYSEDPDDLIPCSGSNEVICKILAPDTDSDGEPNLEAPSDPNDPNSDKIELLIEDAMLNLGTPNISVLDFREFL